MAEKKERSTKAYQFVFTLYPESQQQAIEYVQNNYPCAWALHDKDTYSEASYKKYAKDHGGDCPEWNIGDLKKQHVHFVVKFPNQRYASGVAKDITKHSGDTVTANTICKCLNLYSSYVYLWHENDPDKYQYNPDIVGTNNFNPPEKNEGVTEEEQVETMFDMPKFNSIYEMARWAYDNGCWATFRKNYNLWKDIWLETKEDVSDA